MWTTWLGASPRTCSCNPPGTTSSRTTMTSWEAPSSLWSSLWPPTSSWLVCTLCWTCWLPAGPASTATGSIPIDLSPGLTFGLRWVSPSTTTCFTSSLRQSPSGYGCHQPRCPVRHPLSWASSWASWAAWWSLTSSITCGTCCITVFPGCTAPSTPCTTSTTRRSAWSPSTSLVGSYSAWDSGLQWTPFCSSATASRLGASWSSMSTFPLRTTAATTSPGPCITWCPLASGVVHPSMMLTTSGPAPTLPHSSLTWTGWLAPTQCQIPPATLLQESQRSWKGEKTKELELVSHWLCLSFTQTASFVPALIPTLLFFLSSFSFSLSRLPVFPLSLIILYWLPLPPLSNRTWTFFTA